MPYINHRGEEIPTYADRALEVMPESLAEFGMGGEDDANGEILAQIKLSHAILKDAEKKIGGRRLLAEYLGVSYATLCQWFTLRCAPPRMPNQYWPKKRLDELDRRFVALMGRGLDDIFSESLRSYIESPRIAPEVLQRRISAKKVAVFAYAEETRDRMIIESPQSTMVDAEQRGLISKEVRQALKSLTSREQAVLTLRFGFDGGGMHTMEKAGELLRLSRERVRQIEAKAIRKLQQYTRATGLHDFVYKNLIT